MTVGELKELLIGVPDEMEVLIPANTEFIGIFETPDFEISGIEPISDVEIIFNDGEEIGIRDNMLSPIKDAFMLLPKEYYREDTEINPDLN